MKDIERIPGISCIVGESPVWDAVQNAWLWVDIPARRIWRLDAATGATRHWDSPEMTACLAPASDGSFIAGMETGIFRLALGEGSQAQAARLGAPPQLKAGTRFNDGRCDRQGRFWSGTMVLDMAEGRPEGHLFCYSSAHGMSEPVVSDLIVQNGLCFSPDGRTMYLSDSHGSRQLVWAFDYDPESGVPSRQRLFVDMNAHPGRPDGAAMDVDGGYWICGNDAGVILRFTPQGVLDRSIELPMKKPSMCAFGGADLRTLLVTSISAGAPAGDEWAGATILVDPGVQGMPEARFAA